MPTTLLVLALILVVLFLYVASRPGTFEVVRSTSINAPAAKIFPFLDDFRQWAHWSPWEKLDPNLQRTHGGTPSGKGSVYAWEGNKQVGAGRMEIVDSVPPSSLSIKLDFLRPFEAHNVVKLVLDSQATATRVTWTMIGTNNFMGKLMGVVLNMDKMVGKDFETGLANLKALAER